MDQIKCDIENGKHMGTIMGMCKVCDLHNVCLACANVENIRRIEYEWQVTYECKHSNCTEMEKIHKLFDNLSTEGKEYAKRHLLN